MPRLIIFGASGDLTSRKLIPALYQLSRKGRLPEGTRIVGVSRTPFSDDAWRESLAKTTAEFSEEPFDRGAWDRFARGIHYGIGLGHHRSDFGRLEQTRQPELLTYEPGLWGPEESTAWMQRQGRQWFDTCPLLH